MISNYKNCAYNYCFTGMVNIANFHTRHLFVRVLSTLVGSSTGHVILASSLNKCWDEYAFSTFESSTVKRYNEQIFEWLGCLLEHLYNSQIIRRLEV